MKINPLFFSFQMTHRQAVDELFSNITWTAGQADDLDDEVILSHWKHPSTNIYVTLVLFIVMNVSLYLATVNWVLPYLLHIIGQITTNYKILYVKN